MNEIIKGIEEAIRLIIKGDPYTYKILFLSLQVSLIALFWSSVIGFPLGFSLAFSKIKGKRGVMNIIYTLMGFPPVVAGLIIYLLLSREGPLGLLEQLFTVNAMIYAQILLALPVIVGLSYLGIKASDKNIRLLAITLGANKLQTAITIVKEARLSMFGALITAFGAAISEVGAAMMVGGNIEGKTRILTTALVLETRKGNFNTAIAFGIILLAISFIVNGILMVMSGARHDD